MSTSVLVTGGSIAGPAAAWALRRAGFSPVLLERAPAPRTAGQNIDIRDAGRDVIDAMGLREAVRARRTGEVGTRFLDRTGRVYASFPAQEGRDGPTAEIEILRGDLSELLTSLTDGEVPRRYGDHVTAVQQDADGVEVTLAGGGRERYDLMVVAEGRRSRTRRLVFGDATGGRDLGEYIAYGTIDRSAADDDWWRWLTATGSRMVSMRPDNQGTIRANLAFFTRPLGLENLGFEAQMAVLRAAFADVGWETPRVLDGFAARPEEFYFERFEQVRLPSYSRGRVVLLGDAAWASGPSGMGTSLALVGAWVLGAELARSYRSDGPATAFAAYERLMRPYAEKVQNFPPGVPRIMFPRSRPGLRVLEAGHRFAALPPVRNLVERAFLSKSGAMPALPQWP
ncbi:FAD-dependent monooxygenase [Kineosporia sp. J2-2]|uniref:FAD-dependent monooxygenase n=1 Tax=Kineosporia corallincola TaxID=2835133 RepID=A0ABS5TE35_9ACTN|nr:FAD-dependent monooxygenase [Kineosporia corallincola]MBT0768476.1 FAD-dependent monooxygenase [Kineosporia corallincola]